MAALNATQFINVVPVRIDLINDAALYTNVDYYQQIDLTLEDGSAWDPSDAGNVILEWHLELRESAAGSVIATGSVLASPGDSDYPNGVIVIKFPGASLTSDWADREVQWALALEGLGATSPIPIAYGKAHIRSFVTNPA